MTEFEKMIWNELKEIRTDLKHLDQQVSEIRASAAINKVKLTAIISAVSIVFSSIVGVVIKKII